MAFYYFMGKNTSTFPLAIPSASSCFCRESPSSGFKAIAETCFIKNFQILLLTIVNEFVSNLTSSSNCTVCAG